MPRLSAPEAQGPRRHPPSRRCEGTCRADVIRPGRTGSAPAPAPVPTETVLSDVDVVEVPRLRRAVEALRSLQLARASEVDPEPCPFDERQARKEIAELRRRHAKKVAALELSIDTLAQHVQVLTLDNERLRHALARAGSNVAIHGTATGGA